MADAQDAESTHGEELPADDHLSLQELRVAEGDCDDEWNELMEDAKQCEILAVEATRTLEQARTAVKQGRRTNEYLVLCRARYSSTADGG